MISVCAMVISGIASANSAVVKLRAKLRGNHPAELARLGPVVHADPAMKLHLTVLLGIHDRAKLDQLLADQQNPSASRYHRWLTPAQFNKRFGPTRAQTNAAVQWLRSQSMRVKSIDRRGRTIDVIANVTEAEAAFATTIVASGVNFANTSDPSIPAELAGVIVSIQGLDNMHAVMPAGLHRRLPAPGKPSPNAQTLALADISHPGVNDSGAVSPGAISHGSTAFGPFDVEKYYNEEPLISAGNGGVGSPDCVALDEDSDYLDGAVTLFTTTFAFTPFNITRVLPEGTSPGRTGDESEALLDIDYAHATAPATPIHVYISSALYTSIQSSVTDNTCGAISISFVYCGGAPSFYTGLDTLFAQAATQGQSVFIASGDWGAAGLQYDAASNSCVIGTTQNLSEMAASPHVTGVGGTMFNPHFDASGNDTSVVGVAPGGIETAWGSSGGGASKIFAKPTWQSGPGVPDDSARDLPDVAIIASTPGVFIGADVSGVAQIQCCWGGTSLAAPLWAGYSRVIAEQQGSARLGLLNPTIYSLAKTGLLANGIEDVTSGNNSFNDVTGFNAGTGYDLVTGWGSVDMTAFASAYNGTPQATPSPTPSPTPVPTPSPTPVPTPTSSPTPTPKRSETRYPVLAPAPLRLSRSSISFGGARVGRTSATFSVTLSNPAKISRSATITSAKLLAASNFTIVSSTCTAGKTLSRGSSCMVGVKFAPDSKGVKMDALEFVDSAFNSPQNVSLRGTGK
ncbi:MAG: protease pro-enzyme activation domain-containing protein [Candidatus Binataceae bacterium]